MEGSGGLEHDDKKQDDDSDSLSNTQEENHDRLEEKSLRVSDETGVDQGRPKPSVLLPSSTRVSRKNDKDGEEDVPVSFPQKVRSWWIKLSQESPIQTNSRRPLMPTSHDSLFAMIFPSQCYLDCAYSKISNRIETNRA